MSFDFDFVCLVPQSNAKGGKLTLGGVEEQFSKNKTHRHAKWQSMNVFLS